MISTPKEFYDLRTSEDMSEQRRAAMEEASADVWREISATYPEMREWVVINKTVPIEILDELSKDENFRVRAIVATKRKLSEDIFNRLASDLNESVRIAVANNAKIPEYLKEMLRNDKSALVRKAVNLR